MAVTTIRSQVAFARALQGPKPLVVMWSGKQWCQHCNVMEPIFAEYADALPNVTFLCVDEASGATFASLAPQWLTERDGLPTFMVIKNGKRVAKRGGSMSNAAFARWIEGALAR